MLVTKALTIFVICFRLVFFFSLVYFFRPVYFFARRTRNIALSILAPFRSIWAIFSQIYALFWCTFYRPQQCGGVPKFTSIRYVCTYAFSLEFRLFGRLSPPTECKQHLSYNRPAIHSCPCHATTAFDISANTRSYICIHQDSVLVGHTQENTLNTQTYTCIQK